MSNKVDDEALAWAQLRGERTLDAHQQADFDAWYAAPRHQGAYLRARAIQHTVGQVAVPDSLRPPSAHAHAHANSAATSDQAVAGHTPSALPGRPQRRRAMLGGGLALAAGALLAVKAGWFTTRPEPIVLQTARGELRKVPLADLSVASINGDSHLEVRYTQAERRLSLLRGEAWFEVAKDKTKPFIVEAGGVRVRAVGTAFSVRRRGNGADVLVTEGVVDVWADGGTAVKRQLHAGDQAYVADQPGDIRVTQAPADIARRLAWRDGKLVFQNDTLSAVAADFNRYNARQIVITDPALNSKTFVGQYRIGDPVRFAEDVRALMKVPVEVGPDRISIGAPAARSAAAPQPPARR